MELCRQILTRPETFTDDAFLGSIATACEHLDELLERLTGSVRGCAAQLDKVLSCGRQLVEDLLPVLLLAITDAIDVGTLPLLSVGGLAQSALYAEGDPTVTDIFGTLWKCDCGRILRELLFSQHLQELWGLERSTERRHGSRGFLDEFLKLRHKWMDALDEQGSLECSGLQELFRSPDSRDLQQVYLDLYKHIDNVVKFLSAAVHYKTLANIAGDAAMYHLRDRLHHLLHEIELGVVQVFHAVSNIMGQVRHTVTDVTLRDPCPHGRRRLWLERLQYIDESFSVRNYRGLLDAIQQLRYLSSEARLPALQASCRGALEQIAGISSSPEFRLRCAETPPEAALPDFFQPPDSSLRPLPCAPPQGQLAITDAKLIREVPPWSMERQISRSCQEAAAPVLRLPETLPVPFFQRESAGDLGDVVDGLNCGSISSSAGVCVVHCEGSQEYVALYTPGAEEAALKALGLEEAVSTEGSPVIEELEKAQMEAEYYAVLFAAVLPFLADGQSDLLTGRRVQAFLERSGLEATVLKEIFALEGGADKVLIDVDALQRLGRLVAHAQAGRIDLAAARNVVPPAPPQLRGLEWDGRRVKVKEALA